MRKPVIVRAEAEADLTQAYQWYEQQVRDLGGEFLFCVDAVMAAIERNPQLYPVVYKGVIRRALMRRFPYGVFFVEGEAKRFHHCSSSCEAQPASLARPSLRISEQGNLPTCHSSRTEKTRCGLVSRLKDKIDKLN